MCNPLVNLFVSCCAGTHDVLDYTVIKENTVPKQHREKGQEADILRTDVYRQETDHATTAGRLRNAAIIAGFVALAALAVGVLAAGVFFGAPLVAAAAGATVAAYALHALIGAAVVTGLSLAVMGLLLGGMYSERTKAAEYEASLLPQRM